jgi:hypothetical protein
MASIIRAVPGDGQVYFSNPGQASGRLNGRLRQALNCSGLLCPWQAELVVAQGASFAYSCLSPLNESHMGLLWETGAEGCEAGSNACLQVFSAVPFAAFGSSAEA